MPQAVMSKIRQYEGNLDCNKEKRRVRLRKVGHPTFLRKNNSIPSNVLFLNFKMTTFQTIEADFVRENCRDLK